MFCKLRPVEDRPRYNAATVCFALPASEKMSETHTPAPAAADKTVVSLLWSPRSHHSNGRMKPRPVGAEVCVCPTDPEVVYSLQEVSYSPQANQRTKYEPGFNPIGPTRLTFIADSQRDDDITAGVRS